MSTAKIYLDCVKVTDGQGVGEGAFEVRIVVYEQGEPGDPGAPPGSDGWYPDDPKLKLAWPSLHDSTKVKKNGTIKQIDREVGSYDVGTTPLHRSFQVDVTEVDKGTLGEDDHGVKKIEFDLNNGMSSTTKTLNIPLSRPHSKQNGEVQVKMTARLV
jgi:hypothetical protein